MSALRRGASGLCAVVLLALLAAPVAAQRGQFIGNFSYQYGLPSGDASDFTDNDSWVGFLLEGDRFTSESLAFGGSIGWTELYQQTENTTLELDNGAINGRVYSHLAVLPILARVRYVLGQGTLGLRPVLGLHAGTYYIQQTADVGIFSAEASAWHFGVAPEAGILYFLQSGLVMQIIGRYNLPLEAGEYLGGESHSWPYWGLSIGFGYRR